MKQQKKACLVTVCKQNDHYGFQITDKKNWYKYRRGNAKVKSFQGIHPTAANLSEAGSSELKVVSYYECQTFRWDHCDATVFCCVNTSKLLPFRLAYMISKQQHKMKRSSTKRDLSPINYMTLFFYWWSKMIGKTFSVTYPVVKWHTKSW